MNLRSGTTTQKFVRKTKTKKGHVANECTMAGSDMEKNLKSMLTEFKDDISKQIGGLRADVGKMTTEMIQMREELKGIRSDLREVQDNVKEAEQRINNLEEREDATTVLLKKLVKEQKEMSEKIEYLENKSRQNNIRVYGIQEGLEANDIIGFVTTLLTEKLDTPLDMIQIVAAHRSSAQRPARDAAPRSMVVRFMQWNTRQRVLQAAWSKKEIRIGETRIYFSQDFPSKIQKERSRYFQLRKVLKERNVKSHITYPSKLRVFMDGNAVTYSTLEEADSDLRSKGILQSGDETEPQSRRINVR